jgi:hypothetical protein
MLGIFSGRGVSVSLAFETDVDIAVLIVLDGIGIVD